MAKSEAYANDILDQLFGSGSPATLYIALYTDAPAADGTGGTEVAGGSYARKAVTNDVTNFPAASAGAKANAVAIVFADATANWGIVEAVAILDAASAGNMFYHGALATPRTINNGDGFSIAIGQLIITEN